MIQWFLNDSPKTIFQDFHAFNRKKKLEIRTVGRIVVGVFSTTLLKHKKLKNLDSNYEHVVLKKFH